MKLLLLFLTLSFTTVYVSAKEPKQRQQKSVVPPTPAMVVAAFTFKMTDFASGRVSGDTKGIIDNRYYGWSAPFRFLRLGQTARMRRKIPGGYCLVGDDNAIAQFCWDPHGWADRGDLVEVSAATIKDIYGSDAIVDVIEKPYEQVYREDEAKKRLLILEALKKSGGEPLQAAERLRGNELFFGEKELPRKVIEIQKGALQH